MSMAKAKNAIMLKLFTQTGWRFLWLSLLVLTADQYTKALILENIELYQAIQILPFFNITHIYNYGAAFSFLHDAGGWQRWFLTVIALLVSGLVLWWLKQTSKKQIILPVAFMLMID
jgi:signal peptidase II